MFKSKSFDLVSEEKTKKPERLYQPRRMRWLKYIILPAIFAFAVLLVLCNVDFSNCADEVVSNGTLKQKWIASTVDGPPVYIQERDQDGEGTSLYVSNYKFEKETLDRSFLSGSFRLEQLTLEECQLSRIEHGVFQQNSTRDLLVLKLLNVQLESLSRSSLRGLQSLEDFTLTNEYESFRALEFLSPVSRTLVKASIHQQFGEIAYSVSDFLGNKTYPSLKLLDLSGTNLGGNINDDSFENLVSLERLILKNCGLSQVDAFPSRFHSIQYLDLSGNMFNDPGVRIERMILELDGEEGMKGRIITVPNATERKNTLKRVLRNYAPTVVGSPSTPPTTIATTFFSTEAFTENTTTFESSKKCQQDLCEEIEYYDSDGYPKILPIDYDANITFTDYAVNSVKVDISKVKPSKWSLIYFDFNFSIVYVAQTEFSYLRGTYTVKISNLSCKIPYTYCLLPDDTETSPLNCRSHKISMGCEPQSVSWISKHIGLIIGLGVVAVIVGCLLGMLIMYATLHQKPTLLRGSKHLIRCNPDSKSMYLIPTKGKDDPYSCVGSRLSIVDNHEYIAAYHRYLEQANIRQTESNRYTRPPRERAPSAPPCSETPPALPARITYEYESLELYEELH
ncbi:hypothetical protein KR074_010425 [Drosophila pseudoananassae]|nr:hypothetical protein KR074_010425 [Drosophila pseudoananassae]